MGSCISDDPELLWFDTIAYTHEVRMDRPIDHTRFESMLVWIEQRHGKDGNGRFVHSRGYLAFAFASYEAAFEFQMRWG